MEQCSYNTEVTILEEVARASLQDIAEQAIQNILKTESAKLEKVIREVVEKKVERLTKSVESYYDVRDMRSTVSIRLEFDGESTSYELN